MNTLYSQFDIAAFILVGLILAHSRIAARQGTTRPHVFDAFLAFAMVWLLFDILTIIMINDPAGYPLWLHYTLNTIYISLTFVLPAFFAFYVLMIFEDYQQRELRIYFVFCIPAVICAFVTLIGNYPTHCFFYFDENMVYTHGPFYYILTINVAFYVVAAVMMAVFKRQSIPKSQYFAFPFIAAIALIGCVFVGLCPRYVTSGMTVALCLLVMYMTFQTPEDICDPLTGLYAPRAFYQQVELMLFQNPDISYLMMYVNIRRFKVINDLFGADAGDAFLVTVAEYLSAVCAGKGVCGRLEGDHFILCLPEADYDIENILAGPAGGFLMERSSRDVILVAGVYLVHERELAVNLMCDRARLALAEVDYEGFERYAVYDNDLRLSMLHEQSLLEDMQAAMDEKRFILYYQPVYDLNTGTIISAEALVRWEHPVMGFMTPGGFIGLLERNGSIVALDRFVWKSACEQLALQRAQDRPYVPLSVNVSRLNLLDSGLADWLGGLVDEYGIDPRLIKLEITESCYIGDYAILLETVDALRRRGFIVMMDDFGSAYSSLSALRDMRFDQLKVDMSFLTGDDSQGHNVHILSSVISLAKKLDMLTIAEGVETIEQAQLLRRLGCDAVQGYLCARPMPASEFSRMLEGDMKAEVLL